MYIETHTKRTRDKLSTHGTRAIHWRTLYFAREYHLGVCVYICDICIRTRKTYTPHGCNLLFEIHWCILDLLVYSRSTGLFEIQWSILDVLVYSSLWEPQMCQVHLHTHICGSHTHLWFTHTFVAPTAPHKEEQLPLGSHKCVREDARV